MAKIYTNIQQFGVSKIENKWLVLFSKDAFN